MMNLYVVIIFLLVISAAVVVFFRRRYPASGLSSVLICVIGAWVVIYAVISAIKINSLTQQIDRLSYELSTLEDDVSALYASVNELSYDLIPPLTEDYTFRFHDLDGEDLTLTVDFTAKIPYCESDESFYLELDEDDEDSLIDLARSGNTISGSFTVDLIKDVYIVPTLYSDYRPEQVLSDFPDDLCQLLCAWTPDILRLEYLNPTYQNGSLSLSSAPDQTIEIRQPQVEGLTYDNVSVVLMLAGKPVKELPLTFTDGIAPFSINENIPIKEGQSFNLCLKAVTNAGCTIQETLDSYEWSEDSTIAYSGRRFTVTDANNRVWSSGDFQTED